MTTMTTMTTTNDTADVADRAHQLTGRPVTVYTRDQEWGWWSPPVFWGGGQDKPESGNELVSG